MTRFVACLLAFCAALCLSSLDGRAQPAPPEAAAARLDFVRQEIERIEAGLGRGRLADAELQRARADVDAAGAVAVEIEQTLAPRRDAIKARLDQLGPAPDAKAPPEAPAAAAERVEQTRAFNEIDAALKRARLLRVQSDQTREAIVAKRRELFAGSLLQRTPSLLSPTLWRSLAVDLPRDARAFATLAEDWAGFIAQQSKGWDVALLVAYVAVIALAARPLRRMAMRLIERGRRSEEPGELHKLLLALWTSLVMVALPLAAIVGAVALFEVFGLASPRFEPALQAAADGLSRVAVAAGLGWGLLAPNQPRWRMFDLTDAVADRILSLVVQIAAIVSIAKFVLALLDASAAAPLTTATVRGVGALIAAGALAAGLVDVARRRAAEGDDPLAALRALFWFGALLIAFCALAGFVTLAAFLVDQIFWTVGVVAVAYVLTRLSRAGFDALLQPEARIGRAMTSSVGLRADSMSQLAVLASGATTLAIIAGAAMLTLAPFGIQSQDVLGSLRAAFFGVEVGGLTLSLSAVVGAIGIFLGLLLVTRGVQRWLDSRWLPSTQLDPGLRNAIRTSFGYVGVIIAAGLALTHVGLGLDRIALVAGALSVGIGLGLQAVVANFVSGLILLWERAIRVGDWIVVGAEQGYVRRINVRS
ncbi:MAG: DUF3772 domain-containing protein, partial [Methylobacteriaceae bacterium]|nr:DUF3772 domain-containing protein [Methylobacteriaceae bacterium]